MRLSFKRFFVLCLFILSGCASPPIKSLGISEPDPHSRGIVLASFPALAKSISLSGVKPKAPRWIVFGEGHRYRYYLQCKKGVMKIVNPVMDFAFEPFEYIINEKYKTVYLPGCDYLAHRFAPGSYVLEYRYYGGRLFSKSFTVEAGSLVYLGSFQTVADLDFDKSDKIDYESIEVQVVDRFNEDLKWFKLKHQQVYKKYQENVTNLSVLPEF